MQSLTQEYAYM